MVHFDIGVASNEAVGIFLGPENRELGRLVRDEPEGTYLHDVFLPEPNTPLTEPDTPFIRRDTVLPDRDASREDD